MAMAAEIAEVAALSDVEAIAIGYAEAAGGNPSLALRWAIEDLLDSERERAAAERHVSAGYVRAILPPPA